MSLLDLRPYLPIKYGRLKLTVFVVVFLVSLIAFPFLLGHSSRQSIAFVLFYGLAIVFYLGWAIVSLSSYKYRNHRGYWLRVHMHNGEMDFQIQENGEPPSELCSCVIAHAVDVDGAIEYVLVGGVPEICWHELLIPLGGPVQWGRVYFMTVNKSWYGKHLFCSKVRLSPHADRILSPDGCRILLTDVSEQPIELYGETVFQLLRSPRISAHYVWQELVGYLLRDVDETRGLMRSAEQDRDKAEEARFDLGWRLKALLDQCIEALQVVAAPTGHRLARSESGKQIRLILAGAILTSLPQDDPRRPFVEQYSEEKLPRPVPTARPRADTVSAPISTP